MSLRTQTPAAQALSRLPRSFADHLRQRRHALGLTEGQAARCLGVNLWTLGNWERERTEPRLSSFPAIHAFLGYCPLPPARRTLGERLVAWRRAHGLSREAAATRLGLYRGTLSKVERGEPVTRRICVALERALHGAPE